MAAGALANFATALVLFFVVALIGLSLPVGGLSQVATIPAGSLFDGTAVEVGDAIEKVNGEGFADFSAFYDLLENYQGESIAFSLIRNESGEDYQVSVRPAFGGRAGIVQIVAVLEDSPAASAGIQAGDLVIAINYKSIPASGDAVSAINEAARESEGKPLALTILREQEDGAQERFDVTLIPRSNPPEGEGRMGVGVRSLFGLGDQTRFANGGYKYELIPQSLPDAIAHSFRTMGETFKIIASIPGRLLDGSLSGKDARPISIIGISKIGGEFLQRSLQEGPGLMLNFIALISIFLGISNLLPIPALDGGRIVFVLIEVVRGKPINPELEGRIHQIGIMLLLALGVIIMIYDVINPPSIT